MNRIGSGFPRHILAALIVFGCLAAAACSDDESRPIEYNIGLNQGITLISSSGTTDVYEGGAVTITASVANDPTGAGVTWVLSGPGALTAMTSTTVEYVPPLSGVTGSETAVLAATSKASPSETGQITLLILGAPTIQPATQTLFPAYIGQGYAANVPVTGGLAPFTWTLTSGALPKALELYGADSMAQISSAANTNGKIPTTTITGTYTAGLTVTDSLGRTATVTVTLVVNPASTCELQGGTYAYLFSGYIAGLPASQAGTITIASDGSITGERDYKDTNGTVVADPLTGTCTINETNTGRLTLRGSTGTNVFNYATNTPDSSGNIDSGRLQLAIQGSDSGSGEFTRQDSTALSASALAGDFAFGLLGADASTSLPLHFGLAGRLTLDANGNVTDGLADGNDLSTPITDGALTGTFSAPDAWGRGTATLAAGGQDLALAYYIVNANELYVVDNDTSATAPRMGGHMTRQQITGFDGTALANAGILSLFGTEGASDPSTIMSLGRIAGSSSTAGIAAGTADVILDIADQETTSAQNDFSGSSYSIDTTGRGTFAFGNGSARTFVMYLDNIDDGYVIEENSTSGNAGLLEAQAATGLSNSLCGMFVSGTQFPQARGPIDLNPALYLSEGQVLSDYSNGAFSIDDTTGYGVGMLTQLGVVTLRAASLYVLQPPDPTTCTGGEMRMLRFGTRSVDASLEWLND